MLFLNIHLSKLNQINMSKFSKMKSFHISMIYVFIILFSFPLLSFKDIGDYKIIDGKVIKKGFDTYYEVGVVNIKFKVQIN